MKRLALVLAAVVVSVTACSGGSDEPVDATPSSASPDAPKATALSDEDGVQVWDLTGEPSDEAFGIPADPPSAAYNSDDPRPVRFELDGTTLELDLTDLTFYHPEGDIFAFLSRSDELSADQLAAAYRDVVEQLGVDDATADAFEADLAAAPTDEAGQVSVSYPDEIRFGDWTLALSAAMSPSVGTGIVTVSAGYKPLPVG